MHDSRPSARRVVGLRSMLSLLVATVTTGLLVGCNIVVPVAYVLEGPGTIPAAYELRETTTAVFVDDPTNAFPRTALRSMVGVQITEGLIANEAISSNLMVDSRDVLALSRALETSNDRVSIERIGREAGVEQVLYVSLDGFALTLDGFTPRPTAVCRIKVLDLAMGSRVFPADDPNGLEVVGQLREVDPANFQSFAKRRRVEDDLAMRLGRNVGELFYEHERVDLGENLGIR
ncbi:MAG: hypothetical protein CMJ54_07610 [Planctomycetaceae bacterium]|nr:hypothetical protein [Planctomycetaceae bacterium]